MTDEREPEAQEAKSVGGRRWPARLALVALVAAVVVLAVGLTGVLVFQTGIAERYVRAQFTARMAEMGIVFDSDAFRLTASPLELHLTNASFRDKLTGEPLFHIREAHITMSIRDAFALNLSRDISIDTTEITGAEVWIRFDETGRSNFSNLKFLEDEPGGRVNFRYESVNFRIGESVIHFGDLSRRIAGEARNVAFLLTPETAGDRQRYLFDLTTTDSTFAYEERSVEDISIKARGVADDLGAEFTAVDVETPLGTAMLSGTLTDWAAPRYNFSVTSSVDLAQGTAIVSPGTALSGVANFKGTISGEGETYRIEGDADSAAMRAEGVYLKAVNVAGTLSGTNSNYEAQGTAIGEMLTFEDFQVDRFRLSGNLRGTGTDFRWWGELEAAAASSGDLSIGRLYLADARAEAKDRRVRAAAARARLATLAIGENKFEGVTTSGVEIGVDGDSLDITAPNANAHSFFSDTYRLEGVEGRALRVTTRNGETNVTLGGIRAGTAEIGGNKGRDVRADEFRLTNRGGATEVALRAARAATITNSIATVYGLDAPVITAKTAGAGLSIYSDKVRVAKVDAGSAIIGSLNIGGVRLTIREGRVEARSDDFAAGDVALTRTESLPDGGRLEGVSVSKPVYVLEPSGRYRASADMSLGGGMVGSIALGAARAAVVVDNDHARFADVTADVMEGRMTGSAAIALSTRGRSKVEADFADLDIGKLLALGTGRTMPLEGATTGRLDMEFAGTDVRNSTGTVTASIAANAGTADRGLIPLTGELRLNAVDGLVTIGDAILRTAASSLTADGRFDLRDEDSDMALDLRSTDASELERLVRVLGLSPALEEQLDSMEARAAGEASFKGTMRGNVFDPDIEGRAEIASVSLRGRTLGRVSADVDRSPAGVEFRNGRLEEPTGGVATFAVNIPFGGENNTSVRAELKDIDAGNLLAALPFELPERIRDLDGRTSGTLNIAGLPDAAAGELDLTAARGLVAGQAFDNLRVRATFRGSEVLVDAAEARVGEGTLAARGSYDWTTGAFRGSVEGKRVPMPLILAVLPPNASVPEIAGTLDVTATAEGVADKASTYNVNFEGVAPDVRVGESSLGQVAFKGRTADQRLTAELTAVLDGRPQIVNATVNFASEDMPFSASTVFDQSPLGPFLAFVPQLKTYAITGTGTGRVEFGGNLRPAAPGGERTFSADNLSGTAEFSQLSMQIRDTPLSAAEPIVIRFDPRSVVFEKARFAGAGSNMTVSGRKALSDAVTNDLTIEGRVNLTLLNLLLADTFFAGLADASVRLNGPYNDPRLSGTATLINASVATFLGADRFQADRVKGRVILASNQIEIEEASGYLGGGKFTGSGGGVLDGLAIERFQFSLTGTDVTVPLPKDFVTTGDAQLAVIGVRPSENEKLQLTISGRVNARRSVYSRDIDLANLVGGRRAPQLSSSGGVVAPPRFDLVIEGRDALVVKNNIADLTASVSLALTGDADDPRLSGRISANSGTIFFRKDRYEVQRGVLEFPPETAIEPVIDLQAEAEIGGYQVYVNLSGPLRDSEQLTATVRSSPALPQADVVSLITTGSLTNTASGIPTFAQTGINTAAEVLTDAIINDPARRATDKLFGLNVFEIDPIISGQQLNPSARLTVGRQINNNLRVTYATNLSQDQNQVIALEYRVSNRLSFVAQYEQRSLNNVTQNRNNFNFEIRLRKRF